MERSSELFYLNCKNELDKQLKFIIKMLYLY